MALRGGEGGIELAEKVRKIEKIAKEGADGVIYDKAVQTSMKKYEEMFKGSADHNLISAFKSLDKNMYHVRENRRNISKNVECFIIATIF